ncbi:amino acid adenylation domain-containing protein [Streptacidiphilus sp. MAP12-20]|uniref:amino acid adenylation domain-containing protein n=1 Tax=Streptacidiphilus sp. MAP12-20 TaxID=3156299 RepID=UPI003510E496
MFITPPPRADARTPVRSCRRTRTPDGWALLRARCPGAPAERLLAGLLAVLTDRYGADWRLVAQEGCGSVTAAARLLADAPTSATWSELLAALDAPPRPEDGGEGEGENAVSTGPAETVVVGLAAPTPLAAPPLSSAALVFTVDGDALTAEWDEELFPLPTEEAIAGHLDRLAGALAREPHAPLSVRGILAPAELAVNGGSPERLPEYPPITLHQLFMLQAWRTPDACALAMGEDRLSYRQLDEASSALAHQVVAAGVRPGDVVGVCGERSLGLFTALVAVLKAGGVFMYLDPDYPAVRLRQFAEVGLPRLLLCGPGGPELGLDLPRLGFPAVPDPAVAGLRHAPDVVVGPEDPAYILFTSGSTGTPKGVLRPHRLHTSRVFLEQGLYQVGSADRHLLKLPVSAREFFWPLATGGTAVIAEPGGERDNEYLVRLIRREGISVLSCVPSMLRVLADTPGFAECPSLRHVFVGGEALHRDLEDRVRGFGYAVHNTFTLTEADYVTHRKERPPQAQAGDASLIGAPVDMRVYVCDQQGRLVPPGLTGEVWTGGPGLATGYHRDPQRTAERFLPNPFGDPQAPVLFRTGDLARHRADGSLEYRGRKDLQIKVRGQRVEPTEVEFWLREHPAVRDAAAIGYPDAEQGAVLVAFVVVAEDGPTEPQLSAFLAERLPSSMLPRHLTVVRRLPKLHSGKVDRAALKLPERARPAQLPPSTPPRTADQARLVRIWRRILQLPEVSTEDTFASLGGDSLRLLLLRSALQDEWRRPVDLADLIDADTVLAQEALLTGRAQRSGAEPRRSGGSGPGPGPGPGPQAIASAVAERARRAQLRHRQQESAPETATGTVRATARATAREAREPR